MLYVAGLYKNKNISYNWFENKFHFELSTHNRTRYDTMVVLCDECACHVTTAFISPMAHCITVNVSCHTWCLAVILSQRSQSCLNQTGHILINLSHIRSCHSQLVLHPVMSQPASVMMAVICSVEKICMFSPSHLSLSLLCLRYGIQSVFSYGLGSIYSAEKPWLYPSMAVSAQYNYWGHRIGVDNTAQTVQARMYDYRDDVNVSKVDFSYFFPNNISLLEGTYESGNHLDYS